MRRIVVAPRRCDRPRGTFSTNSLSPFCWACNKERGSIRSKDERINILSPCVSRARRVQRDQNESYHRRQHLIRVINRVPLTRSKCYTTLENICGKFSSNLFRLSNLCRNSRVTPPPPPPEKRRRYLTSSTRTLGFFFSIDPAHVSGQEEIERKQFYLLAFSRCGARHGVARSNDSDRSPRKETAPMFAIFTFFVALLLFQ